MVSRSISKSTPDEYEAARETHDVGGNDVVPQAARRGDGRGVAEVRLKAHHMREKGIAADGGGKRA